MGVGIWIIKAAVQKTISILPFKQKINYFFQRYITRAVRLTDQHFKWKVEHARDHIRHFCLNQGSIENKVILELGTGWYPIIPVAMFLNGAQRVISYDIQNWLTIETIVVAIERLLLAKSKNELPSELINAPSSKWDVLAQIIAEKQKLSLSEIKSRINFETKIQDVRASGLPNASVDLICSNNTFEHIYPNVLKGVLIEFKRVLKPEGRMSHFIDLTDHFSHFDKSITIYNYLTFSNKEWSFIDNDIQPQNRLRWFEYKNMFDEIGLTYEERNVNNGELDKLDVQNLHSDYKKIDVKQLAISHGYLCT